MDLHTNRDEFEEAREIAKRYEQRSDDDSDLEEEELDNTIYQRKNLPTPDGPKLWMLKCKVRIQR
jgi:hypothetical protein